MESSVRLDDVPRVAARGVKHEGERIGLAGPTWQSLPLGAQLYVAAVIVAGASLFVLSVPRVLPHVLFFVLLAFSCVTSAWKVTLPIPISNGSTLSVSYAANLMALLLLGTHDAVIVAVAGAWMQCAYKVRQPYPVYRTVFSAAGASITMTVTGLVYQSVGGPAAPMHGADLARPLVATIATYFVVNTGLVAAAISLSTGRGLLATWSRDFLWSGASFMVAGTAGAIGAIVFARGEQWKAVLLIAPIYLTYRTYEVFVGRLEDQKRHMAEMRRLHDETVAALAQAREAEHALAAEKERLDDALVEMTRLEQARVQLLEREQAARTSAEEANRLKDEFLAIVSHELRTPLTAILGWADMLRRRTLQENLRDRAFGAIYDSARRQAELIDDLLDVSRIMSGKMRLERTVVNVENVVRDALQVVQPVADGKSVRLVLEADPAVGSVYGDAARLQQIVWNLLSNAVKFTGAHGTVRIGLRRDDATVEIVVSDTGQGIPKEFLPWVFEPFRQADGSTTRVHPGLGLGLSIVKNLVEAHNGTICVESAGRGLGATFVVRLPVVSATAPVAARGASVSSLPEPPNESLDGLSVLVVDDDIETREIVAAQLQQCRASVVTAASAAEAFDLLGRRHVDVLLADIGMPEEDGYALIRRVRASAGTMASIPAAALTAFARQEDRQQALEAGFQLHLPKPIDPPSLIAAVASLGNARLA